MDGGEEDESTPVRITNSTQVVDVFIPPSDIDSCVRFSLYRWILSILSIVLVVTDIPRTGLGLQTMRDYFSPVAPDTVMYFGPYAYQIAHIRMDTQASGDTSSPLFSGTCEGDAIDAVDLWSYKYDSLSISTRALAEHLDVSAYPPCVLYRGRCHGGTLGIQTVFAMLDGVISAVTARLLSEPAESGKPSYTSRIPTFKFATKSLWIDRLHHFLVKLLSQHSEVRAHSVQYFNPASEQLRTNICDPVSLDTGSLAEPAVRPDICYHPFGWLCDHPELEASVQVPLWDHLSLRLTALRRQYPDLSFDLTTVSTQIGLKSSRWFLIPSLTYAIDNIELTTLVRGRRCSDDDQRSDSPSCTTVVVDDYRYERSSMESDASQWYAVTSFLRGAGQTYMWIRILCLFVGCYRARSAESKFEYADWQTRTQHALLTFFKIPSHVIIYGSWVPVTCYAFAHYIDCSWIHLLNDNAWSSINGTVNFDLVVYFTVASIQMRNIWFVSLVLKVMSLGHHYVLEARAKPWRPVDGIIGVRGMIIGGISSLTIFGPLRAKSFRDTSIVSFDILSDRVPLHERNGSGFENPAEYGFHFDLKMLAIAVVAVFLAAQVVHLIVAVFAPDVNLAVASRSHFVPYSADTLWSRGSMVTYWRVRMDSPSTPAASSLRHVANSQTPHVHFVQKKSHFLT
ncbi:hypothetical protein Gpo141_00012206, partial [Globisporangium polare]